MSSVETELTETDGCVAPNRCVLSPRLAERLGKRPGSHVRAAAASSAYYVVAAVRGGPAFRTGAEGVARIGAEPGDAVTVSGTVPLDDYDEAWRTGGLAETLWEEGRRVLISCPHGGDVEKNTDVMGSHLYKMLRRNGVAATAWLCHGFDTGADSKDSYGRWHLEKPVEARDAYPELRRIADRRFDCAVGLHLQTHNYDRIGVGGRASDRLRKAVAERLRDELGSSVEVAWRYDEFKLTGRGETNSVNHFARNDEGVQVEMPPAVCRNKFRTVPRALRDALLDAVCGSSGT